MRDLLISLTQSLSNKLLVCAHQECRIKQKLNIKAAELSQKVDDFGERQDLISKL